MTRTARKVSHDLKDWIQREMTLAEEELRIIFSQKHSARYTDNKYQLKIFLVFTATFSLSKIFFKKNHINT